MEPIEEKTKQKEIKIKHVYKLNLLFHKPVIVFALRKYGTPKVCGKLLQLTVFNKILLI